MGYMFLASKTEKQNPAPPPSSLRRRRLRIVIFLLLLLSGHIYLAFTDELYGQNMSLSNVTPNWLREHLPWASPKMAVHDVPVIGKEEPSQQVSNEPIDIPFSPPTVPVVKNTEGDTVSQTNGSDDPPFAPLEGDDYPLPGHLPQVGTSFKHILRRRSCLHSRVI
jgi:hypothetical protein